MNKDLPSASQRRRLLEESSSRLAPAGRALLEAGRWGEALECLAAAGDLEGVADLAGRAREAGDLFFWSRAREILGQAPADGDLTRLQQAAQTQGKISFAAQVEKLLSSDQDK